MSFRTTLTSATVAALTTGSLLFGFATFAQGTGTPAERQGPGFSSEHRDAMTQAFEAGDYAAWKALVEEDGRGGKMFEMVTEENFAQFAQMHALMQSGDREGAQALAEELGLPAMRGLGFMGGGRGKGQFGPGNPENREQLDQALESGDYAAWKALVEEDGRGGQMLESVTEENFAQFAQMHALMQSGDREGAQALAEELGLPKGPARGFGRGKGPGGFGGNCPHAQEEQE